MVFTFKIAIPSSPLKCQRSYAICKLFFICLFIFALRSHSDVLRIFSWVFSQGLFLVLTRELYVVSWISHLQNTLLFILPLWILYDILLLLLIFEAIFILIRGILLCSEITSQKFRDTRYGSADWIWTGCVQDMHLTHYIIFYL